MGSACKTYRQPLMMGNRGIMGEPFFDAVAEINPKVNQAHDEWILYCQFDEKIRFRFALIGLNRYAGVDRIFGKYAFCWLGR